MMQIKAILGAASAFALLSAVPPAQADPLLQADALLQVGTATISGAGTVVTNDPGNTGFDPATSNYRTVIVAGGTLTLQGYKAQTQNDAFTPGALSPAVIGGDISSLQVVGPGSIVNIEGGGAGATGVTVAAPGTLNLSGGILGETKIYAGATLNMSGGVIDPFQETGLRVTGTANITGGFAAVDQVNGFGVLNIMGGTQAGINFGSLAGGKYNNSTLIWQNGVVNLEGTQSSTLNFRLEDQGTLDLFGTFDRHPTGSVIGPGLTGSFSGTPAADSTPTKFIYDTTRGGEIEFNVGAFPLASAAPEPASWALLLLGVGLAGGALRMRPRADPEFQRRRSPPWPNKPRVYND